jgi:hypothetical protein
MSASDAVSIGTSTEARTLTIRKDRLLVPAIAVMFYALGPFELLDYMGSNVKRVVEVGLFLLLLFFGFDLLIKKSSAAFRHPLIYLAIVAFVVELVFVRHVMTALSCAVAIYAIILIYAVTPRVFDRIARTIIVLCGIFSLLGLVQAVILTANPTLVPFTSQPLLQPDLEGIGPYYITHPIALLGMTPGQTRSVFGLEIPRMQSFLREPGLLLSYFLLPGALALLYRGRIRLWAVPIVVFCFLGFTGTVYVSFVIGVGLFVLLSLPLLRSRGRVVGLILTATLTLFALTPNRFELIASTARTLFRNETFLANIQIFEFLDRYESAMFRVQGASDLEAAAETDLVYSGRMPGFVGLIGYGRLRAGWIGVVATVAVLASLFVSATRLSGFGASARLGGALIAGVFAEAAVLQQYGLEMASGFLIMAVTMRRMELVLQARHPSIRARARRARESPPDAREAT